MKALKEKRNSFRSLWRMGLVILSVFALVFMACGDSNTGTPDTPPVSNGGNGNGNGGDDGDDGDNGDNGTPPPPPANPIERLVVKDATITSFSKEGQAPTLTGLKVEIWYKLGGIKDADLADIRTIPLILGEAEINSDAPDTAKPVAITIYHKDDETVRERVMLPGVNALVTSTSGTSRGTSDDNVDTGWNNLHVDGTGAAGSVSPAAKNAAVFGAGDGTNTGGVSIASGASVTGEFYEDGELPEFGYPTVYVQYQGFSDVSGTWLTEATAANKGEETGDTGLYLWEPLTLNKNYVFSDYNGSFRDISDPVPATDVRYAYGIDDDPTDGKYVYFLVSKGRIHGSTANSSIYVRVPWASSFKFHYVRAVDVSVSWESAEAGKYPYLTQAEALKQTDWTAALLKRSDLKLTVYYQDADPIERDMSFFQRAVSLGVAGIVNDPVSSLLLDSSEENFGELLIGYYTSAPFNGRNPVGMGDFSNVAVHKLPIATFVEGSGFLKKQKTAGEGEAKDLIFIVNPDGPTWTGRIELEQLRAVQNTYDFWGMFSYQGGTAVEGSIIPGADFRVNFFPGTPLRVREVEDAEISFVVPSGAAMAGSAAVNAGGTTAPVLGPLSGNNKARIYSKFSGEEGQFTAKVYPVDYDAWN